MQAERRKILPLGNASAIVGMILCTLTGLVVLIGIMTLKHYARAIGGADGLDDQNHLAWFGFLAKVLLPIVAAFVGFWRLNKASACGAVLPRVERAIYLMAAVAALSWAAFVAPFFDLGLLIIAAHALLMIGAVWQNTKA